MSDNLPYAVDADGTVIPQDSRRRVTISTNGSDVRVDANEFTNLELRAALSIILNRLDAPKRQ